MSDTARIEYFIKVLDNPKNAYAKARMPQWLEESKDYAKRMIEKYHYDEKGLSVEHLRVLYICNHMCPNLAHLKHKPIPPAPSYVRREPEAMKEYFEMLSEYEYENTQAPLYRDGELIQPGIHHTAKELQLIMNYVERITQ